MVTHTNKQILIGFDEIDALATQVDKVVDTLHLARIVRHSLVHGDDFTSPGCTAYLATLFLETVEAPLMEIDRLLGDMTAKYRERPNWGGLRAAGSSPNTPS